MVACVVQPGYGATPCCTERVGFWPKADMTVRDVDVRFRG